MTASKYERAMTIVDQAEADAFFEKCVADTMSLGRARDEAERIERDQIGYFAGYYDGATRARVERLFRCEHPIFGSIAKNGPPSAEKALRAGLAAGAAMRAQRAADLVMSARAAVKGTTPGPWQWWTSNSWRRLGTIDRGDAVISPTVQRSDGHPDCIVSDEDAAFIAAARTLVPALADAVEAAEAEAAQLRAELAATRGDAERIHASRVVVADKLAAERKRAATMRETLAFYAAAETYNADGAACVVVGPGDRDIDFGQRAREALAATHSNDEKDG